MLISMQRQLYGDLEAKESQSSLPPVLHTIRSAALQKIPYGLMERLNYADLKAMVLEGWIDQVRSALDTKEKQRLSDRGVTRRRATQEEIDAMH